MSNEQTTPDHQGEDLPINDPALIESLNKVHPNYAAAKKHFSAMGNLANTALDKLEKAINNQNKTSNNGN